MAFVKIDAKYKTLSLLASKKKTLWKNIWENIFYNSGKDSNEAMVKYWDLFFPPCG